MKNNSIVKIAVVLLSCAIQYPLKAYAEPLEKYVGSETTKTSWVWSPEYAQRFGLPIEGSRISNGPVKAIGLRITNYQHPGQPAASSCSVELISDSTQAYFTYDLNLFSAFPYMQSGLVPGSYINSQDRAAQGHALLDGRTLTVFLGFMHADKKKSQFLSLRFNFLKKEYLPSLQYISFWSGCRFGKPEEGYENVIHVAHRDSLDKFKPWLDPKSYRIEIPAYLINSMANELQLAIDMNREAAKKIGKQ